MQVKYYLKRPKEKETSIFARISYRGRQLKYYLHETVVPKSWNKAKHREKETLSGGASELNVRLDKTATNIKDIIRKYNNDHGEFPEPLVLKGLLDAELKGDLATSEGAQELQKVTFMSFFADIIHRSTKKGSTVSAGTVGCYQNAFNMITKFSESKKVKVDFDTIDMAFYDRFRDYVLDELGLSQNYFGNHIKQIKAIMNKATEAGHNTNMAFKKKDFKKIQVESESIYLNEGELFAMRKLDLSANPRLSNARDLFLVGAFTGLRFSDFSRLSKETVDMDKGMIRMVQKKTGVLIAIPIHPIVNEIIAQYDGFPKPISNQKLNDYLKEIGEMVPALTVKVPTHQVIEGKKKKVPVEKWKLVMTHTARRSFATNEFDYGEKPLSIMAVTGHTTEKSFRKYIKRTQEDHAADLAASWKKRYAETAL